MTHALNLRIFKGTTILGARDFITRILEMVRIVLITHIFMVGEYGLYALALGTAAVLTQFIMPGINMAIQRFHPEYRKNDPEKAGQFLFSVLLYMVLNTVVVVLLAYLGSEWIVNHYYQKPEFLVPMQFGLILILVNPFNQTLKATLSSLERFKTLFWGDVLEILVSLVGVAGIWLWGGDLAVLITTLVGATLFKVLLFLGALRKDIIFGMPRLGREVLKFWMPFIASSFITSIRKELPTIILGRLLIASEIGIYRIADRTIRVAYALLAPYISTVTVICLNAYQEARDHFATLLRQHFKFMWILSLGIMGLCIIGATPLFDLVYGEDYQRAVPIFLIFTFAQIFPRMLFYQNIIYSVSKQTRQYFNFVLITTLIEMPLLWFGSAWYGLEGAAYSTIIGHLSAFLLAWALTSRVMEGIIRYNVLIVPFAVAIIFDVVLLKILPQTLLGAIVVAILYVPLFLGALLLTKSLSWKHHFKTPWLRLRQKPESLTKPQESS